MSGEVSPNNHFNRKWIAPEANGNVGIGNRYYPVGNELTCRIQIKGGELIEYAPLIGDGAREHNIEGGNPVAGNHHHLITEIIHIANLAPIEARLTLELEVGFFYGIHGWDE